MRNLKQELVILRVDHGLMDLRVKDLESLKKNLSKKSALIFPQPFGIGKGMKLHYLMSKISMKRTSLPKLDLSK